LEKCFFNYDIFENTRFLANHFLLFGGGSTIQPDLFYTLIKAIWQ